MTSDIKKLIAIIDQQLDWGDPSAWQSRDFEVLSQLIYDKTKVSLSESTLRRIWGRVEYKHLPSTTTLDTLAQFAGFESWRTFIKQRTDKSPGIKANISQAKPTERTGINVTYIILIVVLIATVTASFFIIKTGNKDINVADYRFSSQRLTNDIPNSVIFNYDAANAPIDSVYVQQSWDPHTKTLVDKKMHQHTSVYYEPGFYQAKLLVGKKVVKEHKLMIPTEGWLGLIEDNPVPVYLNPQDFIQKDMLNLPVAVIEQKNMSMQPKPTYVKYYNVGNFTPVPVSDFSYSSEIKNGYKNGEAACQFAAVALVTDSGPIIIPLSIKGCVSELTLFSVDWIISGKTANLSGFGINLSNWVKVSCKSTAKTIRYYVDDKQVFEFQLPANNVRIVGVWFGFQGTGAVRNIELKGQGKMVFKAF
jgi:hypothetical protein